MCNKTFSLWTNPEIPIVCVHFVEYNLFSTLSDISNVSLKIPESHNSVMAVGILAHDFLYSLVLENLKPTSLKNIFFLDLQTNQWSLHWVIYWQSVKVFYWHHDSQKLFSKRHPCQLLQRRRQPPLPLSFFPLPSVFYPWNTYVMLWWRNDHCRIMRINHIRIAELRLA